MAYARYSKHLGQGWFRRAMNNEPSLLFAGIFGVGILVVPALYVPYKRSKGEPVMAMDLPESHPFLHRFADRDESPDLADYETIMKYYEGKNDYLTNSPPENSDGTPFRGTERQWFRMTGHHFPERKKWTIPEL